MTTIPQTPVFRNSAIRSLLRYVLIPSSYNPLDRNQPQFFWALARGDNCKTVIIVNVAPPPSKKLKLQLKPIRRELKLGKPNPEKTKKRKVDPLVDDDWLRMRPSLSVSHQIH